MELVDLTVSLFPGPTQLSVAFRTWGEPRNEVTLRVYLTTKYPQESRKYTDTVINLPLRLRANKLVWLAWQTGTCIVAALFPGLPHLFVTFQFVFTTTIIL